MAPPSSDSLFLSFQQAIAGRYSIDRELGRGGMGVVYLAREVQLDRLVAIKLLPPDRAADAAIRSRFLDEARTAASLSHPHIVPIHAVDEIDGFVFFVMAFVDGETLAQRVQARGPVPAREATRWLREIAWALSYAHQRGVVHRDIKPDNILLERDSGRALVADFGIAHAIDTATDGVHGTPEFMAPEIAVGGAPSAVSDLYALGVTAYYTLSGRLPFTAATATDVLTQHCTAPVPPLTARGLVVPRRLAQLVTHCLAKSPEGRPASADAIASQLGAALEQRRELPAPLRAFVKRDGRADGAGTIATMLSALGASIAASSTIGPVSGIAMLLGVAVAATAAFGVHAARRLLTQGFVQADLDTAFVAELEMVREERSGPAPRAVVALEWVMRRVTRIGVRTSLALVPFALLGVRFESWQPVASLLAFLLTGTGLLAVGWLGLLQMRKDVDIPFWQSVWTGPLGRLAFTAARKLRGTTAVAPVQTRRATELSLSLAAEQLYDALPKEVRTALGDVPAVLQRLQQDAQQLRRQVSHLADLLGDASSGGDASLDVLRTEHAIVESRMQQTVAALEALRLGLLRLHAGSATVESVTTHVHLALELSANVARMAEAQQDVQALLAPIDGAVRARDDAPATLSSV